MITSFVTKSLEKFFEKGDESGLPTQQIKKIKLILTQLQQISKPSEMDFPGSGVHPLKGNRKGEYAVLVNGNYRICFKFDKKNKEVFDVTYEDYH